MNDIYNASLTKYELANITSATIDFWWFWLSGVALAIRYRLKWCNHLRDELKISIPPTLHMNMVPFIFTNKVK